MPHHYVRVSCRHLMSWAFLAHYFRRTTCGSFLWFALVKNIVASIWSVTPYRSVASSEPNAVGNAIGYAKHRRRSHHAVIRVYDSAGNVIETHEHAGEFKEW